MKPEMPLLKIQKNQPEPSEWGKRNFCNKKTMMNRTTKLFFPVLCSLAFVACQNKTSNNSGETTEEMPEETTVAIEDETMKEDGEWELTFHKASELKASDLFNKLEELVFYTAAPPPAEEGEPGHRFEQIAKLYPLGWSKDGNFAYAEYTISYHLGHQVVYTIKNMNSGEAIWQQEMTFGMAEESAGEEAYGELESDQVILIKGGEPEAKLFEYAWAASEQALPAALQKAGIVVNPSGKFLKQNNYRGISFEVEEQATRDENNPMKYYLKSNQYDPMLIFESYFPASETKVAGVIKSPQSETIAVVVRQKRQFFEMTDEVVPILVGYKLK